MKRKNGKKPKLASHQPGSHPRADVDAALNNIKSNIADYFRNNLPNLPGIDDPHRYILVVKGNVWIPIEVRSDRSEEGRVLHKFKYAYTSGPLSSDLNFETVTLCTNVPDSIHVLKFFSVDNEMGVVVGGSWLDSVGRTHPTGRLVKTLGYASTFCEMIDDEGNVSYIFPSKKPGVAERDTSKRFQYTDISPDHYSACAWLATLYSQNFQQVAEPAASDLLAKSLLFLIYQDKTLLFKNSTGPALLKLVAELGLADSPTVIAILRRWTDTRAYSDNELLAASWSKELRRLSSQAQLQAVIELLIDCFDDISDIDSFIAGCPGLSFLMKDKGDYYGGILGIHLKYKNKLSRAKVAYELSLQLSPDSGYLGNYATILYRLGHYAEAEKYALESAAGEKRKAYEYLRLGHIYFAMQQFEKASSYYSMGMAENKGTQSNEASGRYHIAYLYCSLWNAIIDCCIGEGSNFDYSKEHQYRAVNRRETLYLVSLYDYVKALAEAGKPQKKGRSGFSRVLGQVSRLWGCTPPAVDTLAAVAAPAAGTACDRKIREKSTEFFGFLKKSLNSVYAEDKDVFVWMALLDNGRVRHEWLADLIADRACSMINVLSVRNPEGDVRVQINNKFKPLILKLFRLYIEEFNANHKALALLEFYNGVVFRFDLEAIKSTDLTKAKIQLERLASRLYLDADAAAVAGDEEVRKSFTKLDEGLASKYEAAYQKYFSIIKDYGISLESFREYCESIDSIASTAGSRRIVLEFTQEGDVCGVFVILGRGVEFIPLDFKTYSGTLEDFDLEIARAERDFLFEDFENELQAILARLSEQVHRDVFSRIEFHQGMSIRIVPTGMFHLLPFHALSVDGKRLVNVSDISYSNNITLFNGRSAPPHAPNGYLLVGNPEYEDRPLVGAEAEIAAIRGILPEGRVMTLMRQEATKKKFLDSLKPGINLHIACHAQFNDAYPMTSMFNLYPLDDDEVGTNISAGEIVGWDLKGSNFVFLSACESGKGKVLTGNEAMGLPRGFFIAGVNNVICTMWPLHDDYASGIAASFYRHFRDRDDVVYAFSQSLRDAIDDQVPLFAWAPFKLLTACPLSP